MAFNMGFVAGLQECKGVSNFKFIYVLDQVGWAPVVDWEPKIFKNGRGAISRAPTLTPPSYMMGSWLSHFGGNQIAQALAPTLRKDIIAIKGKVRHPRTSNEFSSFYCSL